MFYTPIVTTLAYVVSSDKTQVLLIHRNARLDDRSFGKYNGLGGKVERGEDIGAGLSRELSEEAAITAKSAELRGTVLWPGFGKNGEDVMAFIFLITAWEGEIASVNHEGTLAWHPVTRLLSGELPLWSGDKHFLPLVFDADPRPFHGVMPYANGEPVSWSVTRL